MKCVPLNVEWKLYSATLLARFEIMNRTATLEETPSILDFGNSQTPDCLKIKTWCLPSSLTKYTHAKKKPTEDSLNRHHIRAVCLLTLLFLAVPLFAQRGAGADPLSGTWTGDWGPNASDRNTVSVDLKWDGKAVTGVVHSVNFKRPDVTLQKGTFDAKTGAIHLEADSANAMGGPAVHFVIDGKVTNGSMSGSWNHDSTKGDFKLTKK